MGFNIISAAEAASYIKHGYNIGLSGFTPAGTPKAVTPEVAKIAEEEHAKGNPFQISIFTGASTGDATDGILSRVKAIRYRAPYTTNPDFRKAVNNGEIAYNDRTIRGKIGAERTVTRIKFYQFLVCINPNMIICISHYLIHLITVHTASLIITDQLIL